MNLRIAWNGGFRAIGRVRMLTLSAPQVEMLGTGCCPVEAHELPQDLARIDELLGEPELLRPIAEHWRREGSGAAVRPRLAAGRRSRWRPFCG
jgi:hypothetical protein